MSDETSRAAARSPNDLRAIFEEHAKYVIRTLRHFGVPAADVEDVAQEVFVIVERRLPTFEGRSCLRTWLNAICYRTASDHRRSAYARRYRLHEDPSAESDGERVGDEPDSAYESRASLEALLGTLDEDKRAVFVLYEIEGFNMREVSEIVGCPIQTAYSRLQAARVVLQGVWAEQHEELSGIRLRVRPESDGDAAAAGTKRGRTLAVARKR